MAFWERVALFLKRYSLKKEVKVLETLKEARGFLIHLSKENTLFDISSIAILSYYYKKAQFWAIVKEEKEPLLKCIPYFDNILFYKNQRDIVRELKGYKPQVFIDFNHPGSIRLALASKSDLRWGFYSKSAFPYFNLLIKDSKNNSFSLVASFFKGVKPKTVTLKLSKDIRDRAKEWLKGKGYKRGRPFTLLDSKFYEILKEKIEGLVLNIEEIDREILPGVVSFSHRFIGGPGLFFELSIGFKKESLLLLKEGSPYPPKVGFLKILEFKDLTHLPYKEIEELIK